MIETATHTLWGRGMPGAAVDGTFPSSPDQIVLAILRCVDLLMLFCYKRHYLIPEFAFKILFYLPKN